MKEATGELNLTIIVVIAVGLLIAFFYYGIWPTLNGNFKANSMCSKAWCENPCKKNGSVKGNNTCDKVVGEGKMAKCYVGNDKSNPIYCPWKG